MRTTRTPSWSSTKCCPRRCEGNTPRKVGICNKWFGKPGFWGEAVPTAFRAKICLDAFPQRCSSDLVPAPSSCSGSATHLSLCAKALLKLVPLSRLFQPPPSPYLAPTIPPPNKLHFGVQPPDMGSQRPTFGGAEKLQKRIISDSPRFSLLADPPPSANVPGMTPMNVISPFWHFRANFFDVFGKICPEKKKGA